MPSSTVSTLFPQAPEIPDYVKSHAPWSISKSGVIEKCAWQFEKKYISKTPEDSDSRAATVGKAVHTALEVMLRPNPLSLKLAFEHAIAKYELTDPLINEVNGFRDNAVEFVRKMTEWKLKYGVKATLIEENWAMKVDGTPTSFFASKDDGNFFRGVVDYAVITAGNNMLIIDHKSGRQKNMSEYDQQLKSYCVMAVSKYPEIKSITTGVHFVKSGDIVLNDRVNRDLILSHLYPNLMNYIVDAAEKLDGPLKPTINKFCDWCGYKKICPAQAEKNRGQADQ